MRRILTQVYRLAAKFVIPVLVWTLIGIGMYLRINEADLYPISQNDDGLFYVWAGNSILDNFFHPTSLTIFEKNNPQLVWRSQYKNLYPVENFGYRISDPWFDHPPLGTVLIALPARILGYRDFDQIPHMAVRASALFSSIFSLFLTYKLASLIFDKRTGIIALAVFVFWPLAVFSSRQSYIENIMMPFWLLSLITTFKLKTSSNRLWLAVLCLTNFILSWSKIIGFVSFIVSGYFLRKDKKNLLIVTLAAIFSGILYLLYGQLVGGSYFWHNLANQGARGAYLSSFFSIVTHPEIYGLIEDGWWFIGWFSLAYLAGGKTVGRSFISLSSFFWVAALFFLSGTQSNSPWYRYPVYPLMAIGIGVMFDDWWKKSNLFPAILLLVLGFTGFSLSGTDVSSNLLRAGIVVFMGLLTLNRMFMPHQKQFIVSRTVMVIAISLALYGNYLAVMNFPGLICQDRGCVLPEKIEAK